MKTQQQQTATQDGVGKNANTVLSKLIGTSLTKHIKSFIDNSTVYCTTFNGVCIISSCLKIITLTQS